MNVLRSDLEHRKVSVDDISADATSNQMHVGGTRKYIYFSANDIVAKMKKNEEIMVRKKYFGTYFLLQR